MKVTFNSKSEIKKLSKILCDAYPADIIIGVDDLMDARMGEHTQAPLEFGWIPYSD